MAHPLRRRLHETGTGHIGADGNGTVNTKAGTRNVSFKLTRAFPHGALYDASGKAYAWPAKKEAESADLE